KGQRDPAHAGPADRIELIGHAVRRADEGIATDRMRGKIAPLLLVFLGRNSLRRDALIRKHAVDRAPIGVLDDRVAVVILRLLLAGATDHLADGEAPVLAALPLRRTFDLGDLLGVALHRRARARGRHEEGITIT